MDFDYPPDVMMLRDMLRRFVEKEVRPLEMKYLTSGELELEERDRLRKAIEQMGLWGAVVPECYGGGGLDMVTACVVEEELGKTFLPLEKGDVPVLLYACKGDQVERFLQPVLYARRKAVIAAREPDDLGVESWSTFADLEQGGSINGTKLLADYPRPEDFLIVFTNTPMGTTAFLLEGDERGITVKSVNETIVLELQDCQVGLDRILGEVGRAFSLGSKEVPLVWIRSGARSVGTAGRLLEMGATYAKDWKWFDEPLTARPAVRRMLADLQVEIESARWLVYRAAWRVDQGEEGHIPAAEVRIATTEMLKHVADQITMVYGGASPFWSALDKVRKGRVPQMTHSNLEGARALVANALITEVS